MNTILYSGPRHAWEIARQILEPQYATVYSAPVPAELLPQFAQCTAFLDASMKVPITARDIATAANLKLISTATTGASHIDQEALAQRNIPLLTLKGAHEILHNLTPAAEMSWLLLMACARQLRAAIDHVQGGEWERTRFPGIMLKGCLLGIIGFGRLGSWMARYAQAFDMQVQAYDPFVKEYPPGVQPCELEHLLATSDFITLHVHLTPQTRGLLNADKIKLCKPGSIFINTSRAEITDNAALVEALRRGQLAAVGVDVLTHEPQVNLDPLWQYAQDHQNVIISPHIGGFCPAAVEQVVAFAARRIRNYLDKGEL